MSFLRVKPWAHEGLESSLAAGDIGSFSLPPQTIALRTFLCVVGVVFMLFITAYFIRMEIDDWRPMPENIQLWFNTLLLFLCSVVLQWTRVVLVKGERNKVKLGMLLGGLLTFAFIIGQLFAWQDMVDNGYYLASNPANSFFYILTGLHGIHILGGLWVWTRASMKIWLGGELKEVHLSVELCSVYWHFLLIVWLILFALLSYT